MSGLKTRLLSAAVLIPSVLALILLAPHLLFSIAAVLLALLSGFEYATIAFNGTFSLRRILTATLSAAVAASVAFYHLAPLALLAVVSALAPVALLGFLLGFEKLEEAVRSSVHTAAGAVYTGVPWGLVALIFSSEQNGRYWVLALIVASSLSDTLSFFFGKALGRKKLAPRISPGKTWAGSFGGLAGSFIGIAAAKTLFLSEIGWLEMLFLGAVLGLLFQLGDLAESFLKRGFGVKDSGGTIPGHGGILDRTDALLFGAPALFLFISFRGAL